jgi:hypothetical protein
MSLKTTEPLYVDYVLASMEQGICRSPLQGHKERTFFEKIISEMELLFF